MNDATPNNVPEPDEADGLVEEGKRVWGRFLDSFKRSEPVDPDLRFVPLEARYEVLEQRGAGGMGVVFRARDRQFDRDVAFKRIKPELTRGASDRAAFLARFYREAQITGKLSHPTIVPVHDLGQEADGNLFYSMKLVEGDSFDRHIAEFHAARARAKRKQPAFTLPGSSRSWRLADLLDVLVRVGEGVAYAHEQGVCHRDLKPHNIMVGRFGEVHVMDWGLATWLEGEGERAPSSPRSPFSCYYAAPEQALGQRDRIGTRSDVYSLGAILYHILTGNPPFLGTQESASREHFERCVKSGSLPRVESKFAAPELIRICERATAREPGDRYPSVAAMTDELRLFLSGRAPYDASAWRKAVTWARSNPMLASMSAAAALAVASAAVLFWVFAANSARRAAEATFIAEFASLPVLWTVEPQLGSPNTLPAAIKTNLDALEQTAPESARPMILWLLANWYGQTRDLVRARAALDELEASAPESRPLLECAAARLLDPATPGALPSVEELLAACADPRTPLSRSIVGYTAARARDYVSARTWLTKAIADAESPWIYRDLRAIVNLGHKVGGRFDKFAEATLDAADVQRAVGRETCRTLHVRAHVLAEDQDKDDVAVELWRTSLELGGDQWLPLNQLAATRLKRGAALDAADLQQIDQTCERALSLRPQVKTLAMRAKCAMLTGEFQRALECLADERWVAWRSSEVWGDAYIELHVWWASALGLEGKDLATQEKLMVAHEYFQKAVQNVTPLAMEHRAVQVALSARLGEYTLERAIRSTWDLYCEYCSARQTETDQPQVTMNPRTSPVIAGNLARLLDMWADRNASSTVTFGSDDARQAANFFRLHR